MIIELTINGIEYVCRPKKKGEKLIENEIKSEISENLAKFEEGMQLYEAEYLINPFYKYIMRNNYLKLSNVEAILEIDKPGARSILILAEKCGILYTGSNSNYMVVKEEKNNIINLLNERGML
jgi:hypothetical protein